MQGRTNCDRPACLKRGARPDRLVAHVLGRDRSFILSHAEDAIGGEQAEQFRQCLERRAKGEPLQYITGHQEFFGLDFEVTKRRVDSPARD